MSSSPRERALMALAREGGRVSVASALQGHVEAAETVRADWLRGMLNHYAQQSVGCGYVYDEKGRGSMTPSGRAFGGVTLPMDEADDVQRAYREWRGF